MGDSPEKSDQQGVSFAGRYTVLEELGRGGVGTVYKALDTNSDEIVAIKVLAPALRSDEMLARLSEEVAALAHLNHPNVAAAKAVFVEKGFPFIVMDYVYGKSLEGLVEDERRLDVDRVVEIGLDIARALQHLHDHSVVHGDVKPANIIIDQNGSAVLVDFGITGRRARLSSLATFSDHAFGTPGYMSPEAIESRRVDERSDIYGLGALLYRCLTGTEPSTFGILKPNLPPIRDQRSEVPEWLESIVVRCLATDPAERFRSGAAVWHALAERGGTVQYMEPLRLLIDPGTAPPEFIADILSDISLLYRLSGGSGINFTFDEILAVRGGLV